MSPREDAFAYEDDDEMAATVLVLVAVLVAC